eukprot:sb/3477751/
MEARGMGIVRKIEGDREDLGDGTLYPLWIYRGGGNEGTINKINSSNTISIPARAQHHPSWWKTTNQNSLFRSRDWSSANQGSVFGSCIRSTILVLAYNQSHITITG